MYLVKKRRFNMTKLLEKAFKEAANLSELEQNALARWLLEEIITEKIGSPSDDKILKQIKKHVTIEYK